MRGTLWDLCAFLWVQWPMGHDPSFMVTLFTLTYEAHFGKIRIIFYKKNFASLFVIVCPTITCIMYSTQESRVMSRVLYFDYSVPIQFIFLSQIILILPFSQIYRIHSFHSKKRQEFCDLTWTPFFAT